MKDWTDILSFAEDFEWDEGNIKKNWEKHRVSHIECEEIFFNRPIMVKMIPKFKSEAEEDKFWATHDSTEYVDYSKAKHIIFPNLKPSTKTISIRLPESFR